MTTMITTMVSKAFAKAIGFAGCFLLTIFAGLFGFISLSLLVMSIIYGDILNVAGCAIFGLVGWICWSIRKDTLI